MEITFLKGLPVVPNEKTSSSANDCEVCKISQGKIKPYVGGPVVKLDGNWTFNHYGGTEGFLGWLALQPHRHVKYFGDLNDGESSALGHNLKLIDTVLRDYWAEHFKKDPIERLYALCFSEYSQGHFHFHLIPRTSKMGDLLTYKRDIVAWHIYKIHKYVRFHKKCKDYVVRHNHYNENVENLMEGLKKRIQELSKKNK